MRNKRVKKDALWKPLLRGFRTWVRTQIQKQVESMNLFTDLGEVREEVLNACKNFLIEQGLPTEMNCDKRNVLALIVLLSPSQAGNLTQFFANSAFMKPYLTELTQNFCKVFRENSVFLRQRFFSDRLVRSLWQNYMKV